MKRNFLLKTFMLVAVCLLGVTMAHAAGYTRTLNADIVVSGYENGVLYNFQTNTPAVLPTSGDLRYRDGNIWGLHNFGSGTRSAVVSIPVEANQLVVIQDYAGNATINRGTKNEGLSASLGYICYEITEAAENITFTTPRNGGVVAVVVLSKKADAVDASYTINCVCDGEIISSTSGSGLVGSVPTFTTDNIYTDDSKYIYVSNDAEGKTILGDVQL